MSLEETDPNVSTAIVLLPRSTERVVENCPQCSSVVNVSSLLPLSEIVCNQCQGVFIARRTFNRFQIEELLGRGGMGAVYKALDVTLGRRVALKVLREEFSNDASFVTQLGEEAKITASINHPNVVRVFGQGVSHRMYYVTFELIKGGSLSDLITQEGPLPELGALRLGIQIASALSAAASKGLVHRDVKPGNILLADVHTAKLVDFGLASFRNDVATGIDEVWGSPHYLAPEKLDGLEDFRSDIYSLGATLYHALAGRPVFEGGNADDVAFKHLERRALPIQTFAPGISNATAYCVMHMLERDPADRYQSYEELIQHLEFARNELTRHLEVAHERAEHPSKQLFIPQTTLARRVTADFEEKLGAYAALFTILLIVAAAFACFKITTKMGEHHETPTFQILGDPPAKDPVAPVMLWSIIKPVRIDSANGDSPGVLEDGSILFPFPGPDTSEVTIIAEAGDVEIRQLRLEALTDPSLPANGPGRAANGNFVVNKVSVTATPLHAPDQVPLKIASVETDGIQKGFRAADMIGGKSRGGWAIDLGDGKLNANRTAVFTFDKPVRYPGGTRLFVHLSQQFGLGHTIGKLRLSAGWLKAYDQQGETRGKIISARYGDASMVHSMDVTEALRSAMQSGTTVPLTNVGIAGGKDPARNLRKEVIIYYTFNGEQRKKVFPEDYILEFDEDLK